MSQLESDNGNDTCNHTIVHDDDLDVETEPSGKGITVSMAFTPLLPPPATGEKYRKNAKSQPINCALFIHEDLTLQNLLDTTFEQYDISDKMMYGIGNRSGILAPMNFTITYMILRTNYKNIVLGNLSDFTTIMEEVKEHRSPAFKLTIVKTKYDDGKEAKEDEDAEALPEAKHVNLTPLHLNTWAAAMACMMFQITQTQSSAPSIIINNNFKDIISLLNGDHGPDPAMKNAPQPVLRQQPALQPKLSLLDFCNRFKLSQ
ncbi:uncharacterized protein HD556DRAFT_1309716 [Suillus plorans]|uniref:Uncharacterized protein n=1 Tax=Suillus plorans TaxID=116603 RepID=A0A9P7DGL6_9AGAM|nr:uncharacterized protein HD556DRAFT_1309716 [Suillus plorans]KAG1791920.1 hypothetical protein HD556DRAFT_1309716 [Suillus plorans]